MHTAAKVHAVGASTAELVEMSTIDRALAIAAVYVSQRHSPNGSRTQAGDPGSSIHANAMASSYGGPFDGLTRDQLQLVLKERGLTQRGTRAECIQRLIGTGSKFMAKAKVRVRKQNQTQNAKPLGRRQIKNTSAKALTYTQLCSVALYALGDCTDVREGVFCACMCQLDFCHAIAY